jgi:dnd system-associated protein 4
MSNKDRTQSRVYVPEEVGDLYNLLTAEGTRRETVNPTEVPFFKYKDVFLLAACIGFHHRLRKPLPKGDKKREIRLDTFNESDIDILKALAITETGDVEILNDMPEILTIAEEYAYIGIYELKGQLMGEHGQPLWNLINLLNTRPELT